MLDLFAQSAPTIADGLAGSSGWFGAGLLGLILSWLLLVHLPRQDKRSDDKDQAFLARLEAKDQAHQKVIDAIVANNRESMNAVVAHCKEEMDKITESIRERLGHA